MSVTHNIEYFHTRIEKQIRLASKYIDDPDLYFIIKSCRLKPCKYVFEKLDNDNLLNLYKNWYDEFYNTFNICVGKKIEIIYDDLSINKENVICTDLYYGLSIIDIYKISKLCLIFYGLDEENNGNYCLISFLGIDGYLRSYLYLYNEWQKVSPLLLGLDNLKLISKNIDIKNSVEFLNKENLPLPCNNPNTWLSTCPIQDNILEKIINECNCLKILKG